MVCPVEPTAGPFSPEATVSQPVSSKPSEAQHDLAGSVHVLLDGSVVVVELSGEVDAELGDDLLEVAADVEHVGLPVVVRAGGVTFMDSTGVAFLARLASRSPQRLLLVDPPELVRFLVSVTAIAPLVDVVDEAGAGPSS